MIDTTFWFIQTIQQGQLATQCSGSTSVKIGVVSAHLHLSFLVHLGLNTHPAGGVNGLGTSPSKIIRSLVFSIVGSGIGIADSNALV